MGLLSSIKKVAAKTLDVIAAPITKPIVTLTQGIGAGAKAVEKSRKGIEAGTESGGKVIATGVLTTAVLAGGVLAAGGSAAAGTAGAVARKVVTSKAGSTLILGTGALAVAAPKTLQAVASEPAVAKVAVASAINPALGIVAGLEQGTGLIKEAVTANKDGILDVVKSAGVVLTGVAVAGAGVYAASKLGGFNKDAPTLDNKLPSTTEAQKEVTTNAATPKIPATTTIKTGTTARKKRKPKRKSPTQNISQRVTVLVNQKQNYLKRCVH